MRLSLEDRQRIHAAVAAAESKTSAHLAVTIVPVSDRYALYPLLWGAATALLAGALLALLRPEISLRMAMIAEATIFAAVALALEPYAIRLFAVPRGVRREKARALAQREFAARILAPGHEGILVFASLAERHVELLATAGLHKAVGETEWRMIASRFSAAAAEGRIADAAIQAAQDCARHLTAHMPAAR
ncbi:MAG TPA: hypothetical protein VMH86_15660 [Rhizomicrobium sp.]|nr:hypothetical protein [Rhizomicrobium sp.]